MLPKRTGDGKAKLLVANSLDFQFVELRVIRLTGIRGDFYFIRRRTDVGCEPGHRDVNILEDVARRDGDYALVRLDEIVSLASAMLASKVIGEAESGGELFGFYQETSAVRLPFGRFHGYLPATSFLYWDCGRLLSSVLRDQNSRSDFR